MSNNNLRNLAFKNLRNRRRKPAQAVLLVIMILSVILVTASSAILLSLRELRYARDFVQAEKARWAAEAGVAYGRALLEQDNQSIVDVTEHQLTGTTSDVVSSFSLEFQDEAGKFNLNTQSFLSGSEITTFSNSLGIGIVSDIFEQEDAFIVAEEALSSFVDSKDVRFRDYFTIYSVDNNLDMFLRSRKVFRLSQPREVVGTFLDSGVYYAKALNAIDFCDEDNAQSVGDVFVVRKEVGSPEGGGYFSEGDYYKAFAGNSSSTFTVDLPGLESGEYYVYFYGINTDSIGTVIIDDSGIEESVISGEGLSRKVEIMGSELTFELEPDKDTNSYIKAIEIVSLNSAEGLEHKKIRGVEGIRINEIMIDPSEIVYTQSNHSPGGDWFWQSDHHQSLPSGEAGRWVFEVNRVGYFYLRFIAEQEGDFVGKVSVGGEELSAYHGSWTENPVYINGSIVVYIENPSIVLPATFKGIEITQEPDSEYVELVNISDDIIDISGYTLDINQETGSVLGWPATIPEGTVITPGSFTVLSVDASDVDGPAYLRANSLSFKRIWGEDAVQLEFNNSIEGSDDVIPDDNAEVILYDDRGEIVDAVEYVIASVVPFNSIGRGDPAAAADIDSDGLYDGWENSRALSLATPGMSNKNSLLEKIDPITLEVSYRNQIEQNISNELFENVTSFYGTPSSFAWQSMSSRDISLLADKFTEDVILLFAETEIVILASGESKEWEFDSVKQGRYTLKITTAETIDSAVFITIETAAGPTSGTYVPEDGLLTFGMLTVQEEDFIKVSIENQSLESFSIEEIILEPAQEVHGRINVNTASKNVMDYLFGSYADSIILNRPYGEKNTRLLGVGDLLAFNALSLDKFAEHASFLTVRSDVYEIISTGQSVGLYKSKHKIETVVER